MPTTLFSKPSGLKKCLCFHFFCFLQTPLCKKQPQMLTKKKKKRISVKSQLFYLHLLDQSSDYGNKKEKSGHPQETRIGCW